MSPTRRPAAWVFAAALLALPVINVWAQSDQPSLDELLGLEEPAAPVQSTDQPPSESAPDEPAADPDDHSPELTDAIKRELDPEGLTDTFADAVGQMGEATDRLAKMSDTGLQTQRLQEDILTKLDDVIASAQQQQQQSSSSSAAKAAPQDKKNKDDKDKKNQKDKNQQKNQKDKKDKDQKSPRRIDGENTGKADPQDVVEAEASNRNMKELREEWGSLPPRLRDQLSDGLSERFSPIYRSMTEEYYRRVAELAAEDNQP